MNTKQLDPKILKLFEDYYSTLVNCMSTNLSPEVVVKLDKLRIQRHKALCESLGCNYDYNKDRLGVPYGFDEVMFKNVYDNDITKLAKERYTYYVDKYVCRYGYKTSYNFYDKLHVIRKSVEERSNIFFDYFQKRLDARESFWNSLSEKERTFLYNHGLSHWSFCNTHEFTSTKNIVENRLEIFDKFLDGVTMQDCTEANVNAYVYTYQKLNESLGKLALEDAAQEIGMQRAIKLLEEQGGQTKD